MAMIYISGTGNVGKSSVTRLLKERMPRDKYDIHDIDESDLWTNDYEAWKAAKIEYWLQRAISSSEADITTILCGIIYPKNILNAPSYSSKISIACYLLDATPEVIQERWSLHYGKRLEEDSKVAAKMKRHIEISQELRTAFKDMQQAHIIDTSSLTIESVEKIIEDGVLGFTT